MTASVALATVFIGLSEIPNFSFECNIFVDNFKYSVYLGILQVSKAFLSIVLSFVASGWFSLVSNISNISVGRLEDDLNLVERG
jgi:hypothetical protein